MALPVRIAIPKLSDITDALEAHEEDPNAHNGVFETAVDAQAKADAAEIAAVAQAGDDATTKANAAVVVAERYTDSAVAPKADATSTANAIAAKYAKPDSGIPGADLDAAVRASLSKADSAVQSASAVTGVSTDGGVSYQHGDVIVPTESAVPSIGDATRSNKGVVQIPPWMGGTADALTAAITDTQVAANASIAESKLALASDAAPGTASRRSLGHGATQALPGNDPSTTNARTPTAHASSHLVGGSDAIHLPASAITVTPITGANTTTSDVQATLGVVQTNAAAAAASASGAQTAATGLTTRVTAAESAIMTLEGGVAGGGVTWLALDSDDFGASVIDQSKWAVFDGVPGSAGDGYRLASLVAETNNEMQVRGSGSTVGMVAHNMVRTYGSYEVRVKLDKGVGYGATIGLLPGDGIVPGHGRVDLLRIVNTASSANSSVSVFSAHKADASGNDTAVSRTISADFGDNWHVLRLEWLSDRLSVYLDGTRTYEISATGDVRDLSYIPRVPMYLFAALDVGITGGHLGIPVPTSGTPQPYALHLDYVKVLRPVIGSVASSATLSGGAAVNYVGDAVPPNSALTDWTPTSAFIGPGNALWFRQADEAPVVHLPATTDIALNQQLQLGYQEHVAHYLNATGQAVTGTAPDNTTSSALANLLAMAVNQNDRASFDLAHGWALAHLRRSLPGSTKTNYPSLFARSYNVATSLVTDWSLDSGAELRRLGALIDAWNTWGRIQDRDNASAVLADLESLAITDQGRAYLPADDAQTTVGNGHHVFGGAYFSKHNLGAISPAICRMAYTFSAHPVWLHYIDGYYDLLGKATASGGALATTKGLPPNWVAYDTGTHNVSVITTSVNGWSETDDTHYGPQAQRVVFNAAADYAMYREPRALSFLQGAIKSFYQSTWTTAAKIVTDYAHDGTASVTTESATSYWRAIECLSAADSANATAAAMRTTKLPIAMATSSQGRYFSDAILGTTPTPSRDNEQDAWLNVALDTGLYNEMGQWGPAPTAGSAQPQAIPAAGGLSAGAMAPLDIADTSRAAPSGAYALYVNPANQISSWASGLGAGTKRTRALWAAAQPDACWWGTGWDATGTALRSYLNAAAAVAKMATVVVYDIAPRDLNQFSSTSTLSAYRNTIASVVIPAIGTKSCIVVIEPDALSTIGSLNAEQSASRVAALQWFVQMLKANCPNAFCYIDAGTARGLPADVMAARLRAVHVENANGFALNVSSFVPTPETIAYAGALRGELNLAGVHYVFDTARNGAPDYPTSWSNPPARQIGMTPIFGGPRVTGFDGCDGWGWFKGPGLSDGASGDGAPAAGTLWPAYLYNDTTADNLTTALVSTSSGLLQRPPTPGVANVFLNPQGTGGPPGAGPAPTAPTNLAATGANGAVTITWSPSSGATSYAIYRSTVSGTRGTLLPTSLGASATTYTAPGLTNGTRYYFVVSAQNAGGSADSAQVAAVPAAPVTNPVAVTNLVAVGANGAVTLTWTPGANTDSWDIYRGTMQGGENFVDSAFSPTFTDTGLANGTTYWYQVVAVNTSGYANSTEVSATPVAPSGGAIPGTYSQYGLVFYDDFAVTVAEGDVRAGTTPFLATYGAASARQYKWSAYANNYLTTTGKSVDSGGEGTGDHYGQQNISVVSGIAGATGNAMRLRSHMDSSDGLAWGAAPYPIGYGIGGGENNYQTYGRYEARAKSDSLAAGWHVAWLLWPKDEDDWENNPSVGLPWPQSGETDFPESGYEEAINAYMHWYGATDTSGSQQDAYGSSAMWNAWHTYAIEWKPSSCQFFIDGVSIGHSTGSRVVPHAMRWVLQTETGGGRGSTQLPTVNLYVDYVAIWRYTG